MGGMIAKELCSADVSVGLVRVAQPEVTSVMAYHYIVRVMFGDSPRNETLCSRILRNHTNVAAALKKTSKNETRKYFPFKFIDLPREFFYRQLDSHYNSASRRMMHNSDLALPKKASKKPSRRFFYKGLPPYHLRVWRVMIG